VAKVLNDLGTSSGTEVTGGGLLCLGNVAAEYSTDFTNRHFTDFRGDRNYIG